MPDRRWIVDGIENGVARIEENGKRVFTVPADILPNGVKEGQVLQVRTDDHSLTISIDQTATTAAVAASSKQTGAIRHESARRDKGGDVSL